MATATSSARGTLAEIAPALSGFYQHTMGNRMKAIVQDAYGSADVLELRDVDKPVVADDDVLVRVQAAGVNPGVWHLMTGVPYLMRILGGWAAQTEEQCCGRGCRRTR